MNICLFLILSQFAVYTTSQTFDFVIIGGGTAGLVLANRLSENGRYSVAVIEAGGYYENDFPDAEIPGMDVVGAGMGTSVSSPIDWSFVTTPQAGANNRRLHYARGKCLGGSSARNIMWYHRGTAGSYRKWADEVGDDSYTFENLLPYFKRSVYWTPPKTETSNVTIRYDNSSFFPTGGPLKLSYSTFTHPIFTWFSKILDQTGLPLTNDFSGGVLDGYKYIETTIDPGSHLRSSSESSFLRAAGTRRNLHVLTHSLVEKILINDEKRASGVIVNGTAINAAREVILSAGTLQSPQLLMLSGIGPRAELEKHKTSVVVDLPGVGQNMWDHVMFGPTMIVDVPTAQTDSSAAEAFKLWQTNRTGPLTSTNADAVGFSRFNRTAFATLSQSTQHGLSKFPRDWPELEYLPQSGFVGNQSGDTPPPTSANYAAFVMGLVKPLSRGTITLSSSSPLDPPVIDPQWWTHPADQEVAVAAFKISRQIIQSPAMRPLLADPDVPEVYPGPEISSDEAILKFAKDNIATIWHAAATCKMGKADDELAVLDSNAKVRGVSGLRVVDASAFPFLPPGHPQSTVYALAEKISEEILRGTEGMHCGQYQKSQEYYSAFT